MTSSYLYAAYKLQRQQQRMGGRDLPTFDWICHNANATGPFIIIIIFTPVLNSQGMTKLRYKKYKNQAGMNLTPPYSYSITKLSCSMMALYR